ncbi:MAG: caspase family protein [Ancalomicrobiaceae bacterium]|nr:caspase family protein [Ancalomicrobiaceae bacterium]
MRISPRWFKTLMAALVLILIAALPAAAERRVALVIGNSTYKAVPALTNPRNDAADMATALRSLDFEVIERYDVDKNAIRPLLKDFARKVADADTALVYYAGHALQYHGALYLMPVDAQLEDPTALKFDMLAAADIREVLDRVNGVRIMIFDACRNDPFKDEPEATTAPSAAPTGPTRGLTRIIRPQGSVIAYATAPLDVAEDGTKRNSPFTRSLLKWVREPGLEINQLFQRVRNDVYEITGKRQLPEITVSLLEEFYLNKAETDYSFWARIRFSSDPADFRDFLSRFPSSDFAPDARYRLEAIERGRKVIEDRKAIKLNEQKKRDDAERQRQVDAACQREVSLIGLLSTPEHRSELLQLKASAQCPATLGKVDAIVADIDRRLDEARATCRKEAATIGDLAAAGRRQDLQSLKSAAQCVDTAKAVDVALASIETACGSEATEAARLSAGGDKTGLAALAVHARCPETAARIADGLTQIAALEDKDRQQRASEIEHIKYKQRCVEEEHRLKVLSSADYRSDLEELGKTAQCAETRPLVVAALQAIEADRRAQVCAHEKADLEAIAPASLDPNDLAKVEAQAKSATCAETVAAARGVADAMDKAQKAEQACQIESAELDRLRGLGEAGRDAFNRYLAGVGCQRLQAMAPLPPTAQSPPQQSVPNQSAPTLPKPSVEPSQPSQPTELAPSTPMPPPVQALAVPPPTEVPSQPLPVEVPPVQPPSAQPPPADTPELVAKAAKELKRVACLGQTGEASLEQVRKALKEYYGFKGQKASLTVDQATVGRLEQEGGPVCQVRCPEGEHERRGKCVANASPAPKQRQPRETRPTQAERPTVPSRPQPSAAEKPKGNSVICTGC